MKKLIPLMLLVALSAGFLQYPTAMGWIANLKSRNDMDNYAMQLDALSAAERADLLAAAEDYNHRLALNSVPVTNERNPEYLSLLSVPGTDVIGRVSVPVINANLAIYHGTSDATLLKGAGHLYGSSLPVGGESTHSVISAHSGIVDAEMFTKLEQVRVGDYFYLEVAGRQLAYRVDEIKRVLPEEVKDIKIIPGEDHVTLLTCTPTGINTHRLLVRGVRTPLLANTGDGAKMVSFWEFPGFPWWAAIWVGAIVASGLLGRVVIGPKRQPVPTEARAGLGYPVTSGLPTLTGWLLGELRALQDLIDAVSICTAPGADVRSAEVAR